MNAKQKRFWTLTKAEKRIAIAKDIIKQIKAKMIIPESGIYIVPRKNKTLEEDKQLDQYFNKTPCTTCALGACFIALVDVGDKLKASDILSKSYDGFFDMASLTDDNLWRSELRDIFSPLQLSMIESAFEGSEMEDGRDKWSENHKYGENDNRRTIKRSIAFGKRYGSSEKRLLAIARNIVKNGGKFIP